MNALLTAIVVWLSANFGFPTTFDHPRIEYLPAAEMAALRYKGLLSAHTSEATALRDRMNQPEQVRQIVALYNNQNRTIYLPKGWTGGTPAELSILVHEMVHHLQNLSHATFACPEEREKLAYEAQDKWLKMFGHSLATDFELDGFTILVVTACGQMD